MSWITITLLCEYFENAVVEQKCSSSTEERKGFTSIEIPYTAWRQSWWEKYPNPSSLPPCWWWRTDIPKECQDPTPLISLITDIPTMHSGWGWSSPPKVRSNFGRSANSNELNNTILLHVCYFENTLVEQKCSNQSRTILYSKLSKISQLAPCPAMQEMSHRRLIKQQEQ